MKTLDPDTNIGKLLVSTSQNIISELKKPPYDWRKLISCLDPSYDGGRFSFTSDERDQIAEDANPAALLFTKLANRNMTIAELCPYLEELKHEVSLIQLKELENVYIVQQPISYKEIFEGDHFQINCVAKGLPFPKYKWFRSHKNKDTEKLTDNDTLFIQQASLNDSGIYRCQVFNTFANKVVSVTNSDKCEIKIIPRTQSNLPKVASEKVEVPTIKKQPIAQEVPIGENFTFSLEVESTCFISYQWFHNGCQISGATSKSFTAIADEMSAGDYQCKIQYNNNTKEILSSTASLTVSPFVAHDKIALILSQSGLSGNSLGKLPGAMKDALRIKKVLQEKDLSYKVFLYLDLTRDEIEKTLRLFCSMINEGVYVFIYCVGHGFTADKNKYLVPSRSRNVECECISTNYIRYEVLSHKPSMAFLVYDMCLIRQKDSSSNVVKTTDIPNDLSIGGRTVEIFSTGEGQLAFETISKKEFDSQPEDSYANILWHSQATGIFTSQLINHLRENDVRHIGLLAIEEMKKFQPKFPSNQYPKTDIDLNEKRSLTDPICKESRIKDKNDSFYKEQHDIKCKNKIQGLSFDFLFSNVLYVTYTRQTKDSNVYFRLTDDDRKTGVDLENFENGALVLHLQRLKGPLRLLMNELSDESSTPSLKSLTLDIYDYS